MGNWHILATQDRERGRSYDRDEEYFGRKGSDVEEAYNEGWEDGYKKGKEEISMRGGSMMGRRMNYREEDDDMNYRRGSRRNY